jgi:soluble lytic murein transglycosylase
VKRALAASVVALWSLQASAGPDPFQALRPSYDAKTGVALGLFQARRYEEALRELGTPADEAGRFLEARALFALERFAPAAEKLLALAGTSTLLSDHFRALAARALLGAKDAEAAAREADGVGTGTTARAAAVLVAAEAHLAANRPKEARARAELFVKEWPQKPSAAAALWIAARACAALGQSAEARKAERRLYVDYPSSPHAARIEAPELSPGEAIERASRLIKVHRNDVASRELEAVLSQPRLAADLRCRASYFLGAAEQRRRRHGRANAAFRTAARICRDGDLAARALFLWGKGLLSRRTTAPAAALLERLAQRFPRHRLADDALLLAAQAWRRAKDLGRARADLQRLLREMPNGDMAARARFELARLEIKAGEDDAAVRRLAAMADEDPYPEDPYLRGRPLYTLGRVHERRGARAKAVAAYRRCVQDHPLTYWASLARGRIRSLAGEESETRTFPGGGDRPDALEWPALPEALTRSLAFQRGVALIRLGAGDLAGAELSQAAKEAGATEEVRATLSLVYHLAADWHRSHMIIRSKLREVLARPPTPLRWRLFLLGYPKGFWEVLEPIARQYGVDPLLLTAIVREESAFNPGIESWANAVGLAQLILPTARRIARAIRLRQFRREMLLDPKVNLQLGAKYLSNLLRRFRGSAPLAVAAYNAGELAVERWLKERAGRDLDDFVDAIPYEQTRLYTRRVMESYAAYRYLYGKNGDRLLVLGPGKE